MSHQNNPFGPAPSLAVQHTAAKYPDISGDPSLSHNQPQYQQPQQQQQYGQSQYSQPQQQQQQYLQSQQTGFGFQPQPLQPPQQHAPLLGAHSAFQQPQQTGYQPQQQQFGQQQQYGQQQQQYGYQSNQPSQQTAYHSDLDPYGNLGALSQPQQQQQQQQGGQVNGGGAHGQHPRQYVQEHKAGLTNWDAYEWKQLLNRLDALREAWEASKNTIIATAQSKPGADPSMLDYLKREADTKIDTIHASKLQLSEVESGWRHSTDPASKARVREALNAGLTGLPEFPPPFNPSSLGGSFAQSAYEDQRKSHILSGYGGGLQPQQTGYQPQFQQAQPTGFQGGYQQPQQQQQTGFQAGFQQPQQTGFQPQYQQAQQTGYPGQQQQFGQGGFQQGGGYMQGGAGGGGQQGYGGYQAQGGQGYY